ncbi:MAG TPA: MlaD family protein [Candidatus Binataceae bacterium]|nr:MlaD family protein [Candidatus Binataceae bacterium]
MYATRTTQFIVGLFAILGIAALAFLSLRLGRIDLFGNPGYIVYADFDNIAGLKNNDRVDIAGVPVGHVASIVLKNDRAHLGLFIDDGVEVDSDAIAGIKSSGIIGDKYVAIQLGSGDILHNDGYIRQTQSAFVLEDAIGGLINSLGSGGSSGKNKDSK